MRCDICDKVLSEPKFNRDLDEYEPCDTCLEVIKDTIAGFTDKASADDDAFGEDQLELFKGFGYSSYIFDEG